MTASRRFVLWLGVFGAPLAWSLHLVVGYWFEEASCSTGSSHWGIAEHTAQIAVTASAVTLCVVGLAAAAWSLRAALRGQLPDPRGRVLFLAVVGSGAAVLFLCLSALTGTFVIILDPCTPG